MEIDMYSISFEYICIFLGLPKIYINNNNRPLLVSLVSLYI